MNKVDEIVKLKKHIQEFSTEIVNLKKLVNPKMSSQEYKTVHSRFLTFNNLKAIAKNELNATLHQYKVVLSGRKNSIQEQAADKVVRSRFRSEINCKLILSKKLDLSIPTHDLMYKYIADHYAPFFQEGKFRIKSIIQLK